MPKLTKTFSLIAALFMAGSAFAQDTGATDDGLSLGEEVAGQAYVKEKSGDWDIECVRNQAGQESCQLLQSLLGAENNQVASVRIFRLPEGGRAVAGAVVAVPLETLLTAQLTILVDANPAKRYPFSVCDPLGCYARIGLTQEDIDTYKRGGGAIVSLVPFVAPDNRVDLNLSLSGFTAGYDSIGAP